ncbi:hypothetical protein PHIM7_292 [Sinorhizobium phage phiM7]|uniref:Uncharacterized protein n=1 Tax=Sinorhizobium phage phiM7 TaxID=1647403 RepID=A0A0F6YNR6_9CAUD|nr:hypothetical protein FDH46_gp186 [Sinorhizobium phage phiM7]AKF12837.1 hypothetical protein PHIM7_292 [Sinorhizobium phage phiM7]AKF13197.2 hypothetical protein PHIM19_292 [Sinorhizobium phage phiM19]
MTMMTLLPIVVATIACWFAGFFCGVHRERVAWNQLIKEGKLPKPGQSHQWGRDAR